TWSASCACRAGTSFTATSHGPLRSTTGSSDPGGWRPSIPACCCAAPARGAGEGSAECPDATLRWRCSAADHLTRAPAEAAVDVCAPHAPGRAARDRAAASGVQTGCGDPDLDLGVERPSNGCCGDPHLDFGVLYRHLDRAVFSAQSLPAGARLSQGRVELVVGVPRVVVVEQRVLGFAAARVGDCVRGRVVSL